MASYKRHCSVREKCVLGQSGAWDLASAVDGSDESMLHCQEYSWRIMCSYSEKSEFSPNSVYTEGVLAVILGLADLSNATADVFCDQLLCAGCGDRPCCLAPV